MSNAEIAASLHLSLPTIKTHVSRLLAKLNAGDRAQLIVVPTRTAWRPPASTVPTSRASAHSAARDTW